MINFFIKTVTLFLFLFNVTFAIDFKRTTCENTSSKIEVYFEDQFDIKINIHFNNSIKRRGLSDGVNIWLQCLNDQQELSNILIHEIGHNIHEQYFKPINKVYPSNFKDFNKIIYRSNPLFNFLNISFIDEETIKPTSLDIDFVSFYSKTDPFEDFAETFLMYFRYRDHFKSMAKSSIALRKKFNFMQYHFGDISEYKNNLTRPVFISSLIRTYDASLVHKK